MEKINELTLSAAPHIKGKDSTASIMITVILALIPSGIFGILNFGLRALFVIIISIFSSVLTEYFIIKLQKKPGTLGDGSALLTGLLIAYNMPPAIPLFIPVIASIFAIAVVKHTFGGLGRNWMNPALGGRVFVMFCFTSDMTRWSASNFAPHSSSQAFDAFTGATPLGTGAAQFLSSGGSYLDLFFGYRGGCIGEVSIILLLAGALILLLKKIITWEIPFSFIAVFSLLTWFFAGSLKGGGAAHGDVLFHIMAGGIVLGAFFMATDMVTSPLTPAGMLLFGAGCGGLTFLIRFYGGFPEGVSLAIILMNMFVPLINSFTGPRKYGTKKDIKRPGV